MSMSHSPSHPICSRCELSSPCELNERVNIEGEISLTINVALVNGPSNHYSIRSQQVNIPPSGAADAQMRIWGAGGFAMTPWCGGRGVLARSHGIVFSFAAGGAHWQIAIRCPSLPFPSVKVHQAAVLVRRFSFSMVAGYVNQNIKDPYGNTLLLHEVTFMLMAECFHRVCG